LADPAKQHLCIAANRLRQVRLAGRGAQWEMIR
jgi:hypothetical protein